MAKSQKLHAFSWKGIIISIILLGLFSLLAIIGVQDYTVGHELQVAIDKGIIVEAEIVALRYRSNMPNGRGATYDIMYRYIDESGIVYEGYCGSGDYRTEERDRGRIGEKVEIYIGGVGRSNLTKGIPLCRAVSYGTEVCLSTAFAFISVGFSLIFIYIVLIILYILWFYDKLPKLRRKQRRN